MATPTGVVSPSASAQPKLADSATPLPDAGATPSDAIGVGATLASRYLLKQILGTGAYGRVFRALDTIRRHDVAIKVLRNDSSDALLRFKQEFRALSGIRHPNLIRFHKLGRTPEGVWFLVIEFVNGDSLTSTATGNDRSESSPDLPPTEADIAALAPTGELPTDAPADARVYRHEIAPLFDAEALAQRMAQLASGLRHLHNAGVIHCDLKPSNVLVTQDDRVVILDFGVARYTQHIGAQHQAARAIAGTLPYMSPEFRAGSDPLPSVDWYATGIMLTELLTGLPATTIGAMPPDERDELLDATAESFPAHEHLCALAKGLTHPDPVLRKDGHDLAVVCGDHGPESHVGEDTSDAIPFIRGDRELAHLNHLWNRYRNGETVNVIIEGVAGVGKSALCQEFIWRLSTLAAAPILLIARCRTDELLGYRAFDELVDGVAAVMQTLPEDEAAQLQAHVGQSLAKLFPTLRSFCAAPPDDTNDDKDEVEDAEDALNDLQQLIQKLSERRDVVIWIEDIHLADRHSQRWFAKIFSPGRGPRALLMLTRRPNNDPRIVDQIDIQTLGYAIPIYRIQALDDEIAAQIAQRLLPTNLKKRDELIQHVVRIAHGNPQLLRELCRDPEKARTVDENITLVRLLRERFAGIASESANVLRALATSTVPLNRVQIAQIANLTPDEVERAIDALERSNALWQVAGPKPDDEYYDISQHSIADTILHATPPNELAAYHERHARRGSLSIKDGETFVRHLVKAGLLNEARRHAQQLAEDADQAREWALSARMRDTLLDILRSEGQRPNDDLLRDTIRARLAAGRGVEAARLMLELADDTNKAEAHALRQKAARALLLAGHINEGLRIQSASSPQGVRLPAHLLPDLLESARLEPIIYRKIKNLDINTLDHNPPQNNPLDERVAAYRTLRTNFSITGNSHGYHLTIRELHAAIESQSAPQILHALTAHCTYIAMAGDKNKAKTDTYIQRAQELAKSQDDPNLLHSLKIYEGTSDYHQGNYHLGWAKIRESYRWMRENAPHAQMNLSYINLHHIFFYTTLCNTHALRKLYYPQILTARQNQNPLLEATLTLCGAITWLIDDAPEAATSAIERLHWQPNTRGFHLYDYLRLRAQSDLVIYKKDIGPDLDWLIEQWLPLKSTAFSRSLRLCYDEGRYIHGRLLLARARRDRRLSLRDQLALKLILRALCADDRPLTQGWGYQLRANLAYFHGSHERAKEYLLTAIEIFERAGLTLYADTSRIAGESARLLDPADDTASALRTKGVVAPAKLAHMYHPILC